MRLPGKRLSIAVFVAALSVVLVAAWMLAPAMRTTAFLLDVAGMTDGWRRLLPVAVRPVATEDTRVPTRHGPVTVRIYRPDAGARHTIVVFPGVHGGGVDEPRLVRLCTRLAATGRTVICAPLPELREFQITPRSVDDMEDVTAWAAGTQAATGRVTTIGVSFAGGLALVAAGRPSLAHRLDAVVSLGGYGDLPRALHYLCTGELPDGTMRPPHDYGLAVVAYDAVSDLVPADQSAALAHGIRTFLEASLDDTAEKTTARVLLADARAQAAALPEPARAILTAVTERDTATLGARLDPMLEDLAGDPSLSPERSPAPAVPVFLIHGRDDNVVPSTESQLVARYLRAHGTPRVEVLLTPLVSHARLAAPPTLGDAWRLVRFWERVFAAIG